MGSMDWTPSYISNKGAAPAAEPGGSYLDQYRKAMGTAPAAPGMALRATPTAGAPVAAPSASAPTGPSAEEYAAMPIGDVLQKGVENLGPSALKAGKGMWSAVTHPSETLGTIGDIGKGLYSKAEGALFDRTPEEQAAADEREATVNAIGRQYGDTYGSWGGFKKTLAEDPFAIGMDAATIAPVVGIAGKAAGLEKATALATKAASLGDPINLATKAASVPISAAKGVAKAAGSKLSGVPKEALTLAEEAGRSSDPAARAAYTTYAKGKGDLDGFASTASDAVDALRSKASADYRATRAGMQASMVELPMASIIDKMDELSKFAAGKGRFGAVQKDLAQARASIAATASGRYPGARTMDDLDKLKQSIDDLALANRSNRFSGKFGELAATIKNVIANHDSQYAKMMDNWSEWKRMLVNLKPVMGSGNTPDTAIAARLLKAMKTPEGRKIIAALEQTAPGQYLSYKLSGALTNELLRGGTMGWAELLGSAGMWAMTGHPMAAAPLVLGSPKIMGAAAYNTGKLGRYGDKMGTLAPAPARNAAATLGNLEDQPQGFKAGGRVGINHGAIADKLILAAERSKKGLGKSTEPLLEQPDDAIIKALDVANRSI